MSLRIKRNHRLTLGIAALVLASLWLSARADANAQVYWAHFNGSTLESVAADGSGAPQVLVSGASNPLGVAVGATHIYWANFSGDSIGRANVDGTGVDQAFITGVNPFALAVAEGHIYWTDADSDAIGRADLSGDEIDPDFIEDVGAFFGLAADSKHLYWGNLDDEAIGRADLSGTGVEREFAKPAGPLTPYGVAVDTGHVYWANSQNNSIGRADLGDGEIEEAFIPGAHPAGVAVDAGHVYWGHAIYQGAVGRASIDGSGIDNNWMPAGSTDAFGIATTRPEATLRATTSADVVLGDGAIRGTAALHGANAPTGTITLSLFGPGDETCSGPALLTETVSAAGNGAYRTAFVTPATTGTYRLRASYSGDVENLALHSACGETVKVVAPPPATPSSSAPPSATACTPVAASAATFTPTPRSGRLVPGVRALITVDAPSQVRVAARLTYRLNGKLRRIDLGSHALHASSTAKLRLPLPAGSHPLPALGTKVKVKLRIAAAPDNLPGCAFTSPSLSSFGAKVVKVLAEAKGIRKNG